MTFAYYNENDPRAAAWLRELIYAGAITPGLVDERSIADVTASDLEGFIRCHFFAGIGGWDYALRLAGWPLERPVWTGSCPCQPFSQAGKGGGVNDARHLWPTWFRLISQCRPTTIFGEQVASPAGIGWLDLVSSDLENENYAVGSAVLGAHSVGAPHLRQRLYFVGHTDGGRSGRHAGEIPSAQARSVRSEFDGVEPTSAARGVGESDRTRRQSWGTTAETARYGGTVEPTSCARELEHSTQHRNGTLDGESRSSAREQKPIGGSGIPRPVANAYGGDASAERQQRSGKYGQLTEDNGAGVVADSNGARLEIGEAHEEPADAPIQPITRSNAWAPCDWISCSDGKQRPVESGTFPLAHGVPSRVGLLRGYGNAIVPQTAAEFIGAYIDAVAS